MSPSLRRTAGVVLLSSAFAAFPLTAQAREASGATGKADAGAQPTGERHDDRDAGSRHPRFPAPLQPTSRFFPLRPGTSYVYEGVVKDADGTKRHRIVFTVTDLVKRINGVNARVVFDRDISDGVLAESELAFFSKDRRGNVWNRGEYPEEYEDGVFAGAPSTWIDGVRGARSGILVPGRPRTGTPPFVQGRAPAVDFYDVGTVTRTGMRVCVPTGCYDDVVQVQESAPDAPDDGIQVKYYAPGVGLVKIEARGGGSQETMTLRSLTRLSPAALKEARDGALRLEQRAYRVSADYRTTPRAYVARWVDDDHDHDGD